jgi:hypothetical protein
METQMTASKFMVLVLNRLTYENELYMVQMEKFIRNIENSLFIDELGEKLIQRYERLSLVAETNQ